MSSVYLSQLRSVRPRFLKSQEETLAWLSRAHVRAGLHADAARLIRRFGCGPEHIGFRAVEFDDFLEDDFRGMKLFGDQHGLHGAPTRARMEAYLEASQRALRALYSEEGEGELSTDRGAPHALIHVTCTGYVAPSAAQRLAVDRGWQQRTSVLHAYHMGCYAALPAIRIGRGLALVKTQGASRVDIAHTECCTLHLDPSRHEPEQLVVQSLFADGFIRYSLTAEAPRAQQAFRVLGVHDELVPDSDRAMEWIIGDHGMLMGLARDVPERIGECVGGFVRRLLAEVGLPEGERERAVFAVHPGGPRIIDRVQDLLRLDPMQTEASRRILFERGNMSSATLPHIWERILADDRVKEGTPIVSLAFGPGLTIYGGVMVKEGA